MLQTIVTILMIIGIILLCIIGFILLLAALFVFVASHYKIIANYHNNNYRIYLSITWLYGVLGYKINIDKDKENNFNFLSIFGIKKKIGLSSKKQKKKKTKKKAKTKSNNDVKHGNNVDIEKEVEVKEFKKKDPDSEKIHENHKSDNIKVLKEPNIKAAKRKNRKEKIKKPLVDRISDIVKKIANLITILKDEVNKELLKFFKLRFFELLRHLKPKNIKGNITLGFEDPANTGLALGGLAMLFGFIGKGIRVTPDFEKSILEGEISIKGRIRIFNLLLIFLKVFRKREKIKKTLNEINHI